VREAEAAATHRLALVEDDVNGHDVEWTCSHGWKMMSMVMALSGPAVKECWRAASSAAGTKELHVILRSTEELQAVLLLLLYIWWRSCAWAHCIRR
jgi:hypothetical protein